MDAHRLFGPGHRGFGTLHRQTEGAVDGAGNAIGGILLGVVVSGTFWIGLAAAVTSLVR